MQKFSIFAFLWCASILFHQLFQGRLFVVDATAPLTLAALWTILRPGSLSRFLLLAAVQAAGGSSVCEAAPAWAKSGREMHGDVAALMPLFRALKTRFDPRNVLNPGRFAGGL